MVVAIISILAALLLPGLQNVRELAKSAKCVNNLKQISVALALYEGQYNVLPAAYNGSDTPDKAYWQGRLFSAGFLGGVTQPEYYGAIVRNCEVLKCPSNKGTWLNDGVTPNVYAHYGMNSHLANLIGVPDNAGHSNWYETFVDRGKISRPELRVLVGETTFFIIGGWTTTYGPNGSAWYPHRRGMNILYADYHVAFISQVTLTAQAGKPGDPFGDGE